MGAARILACASCACVLAAVISCSTAPKRTEAVSTVKNQAAQDLMTDAPSPVSPEQLRELNLKLIEEVKTNQP